MLTVMALVFGGFTLLILGSYRAARSREQQGERFQPQGKRRWSE